MNTIKSFEINHILLKEGLYVSRVDEFDSSIITTFDLRMKKPNKGDFLSIKSLHTIEHLGATFLRNHDTFASKTVYFGPMGCQTGFYALFIGELKVDDVKSLFIDLFDFIVNYKGIVPGASEIECGNYLSLDLEEAKKDAEKYLQILKNLNEENTSYPK